MKLTSDLIYGFMGSLLSSRLDEPAPTPDCHREWWDLCCSEYKRVAIAAPRGHAKSTAITKCYTLAAVLFRERRFVLIVSDTYRQAVLFLGEIKRELESNIDLKELFDLREIITDREDDIIVEFNDGYKFRIMALGSEQKVRGLLWDGARPDLIVGDDLENDEIVMNPDRRDKFRVWINNALLPCMSERGIVRFVGTILHMDSMLERLMPKDNDSNTVVTPLKCYMKRPAIDGTAAGWMSVRYAAHGPDGSFEKILWPIKWSEKRLRDHQLTFIGQGNPEGYSQEFLNRPIDAKSAFFRKEDFGDFSESDYTRPWDYCPTYLSVDLAVSTKEKRDYCVFGVGSSDSDGTLYLRHIYRDRLDSKEIVDTILRLQQVYKFPIMLIGKGALEKSIGPFLQEMVHRQGKFLHMEAIPEIIDKRQRAQSIRARMRAGGVKFDKKKKWFPELELECLQFDRGAHDDQVDMLSLFGLYLDQLMDAPTYKQIQEIEWEDAHQEDDQDTGRSEVTGY